MYPVLLEGYRVGDDVIEENWSEMPLNFRQYAFRRLLKRRLRILQSELHPKKPK